MTRPSVGHGLGKNNQRGTEEIDPETCFELAGGVQRIKPPGPVGYLHKCGYRLKHMFNSQATFHAQRFNLNFCIFGLIM